MAKMMKELIEYNISESYERELIVNFKQISVDDVISIPIDKPDIQQVTKVWINYEILDYEIIKTPVGVSNEGQILTGNKVFIYANLKVKFEYVSQECGHSVHSSCAIIPVCAYVTLSDDFNEFYDILPSISVEDAYCEQINCKEVYINIVFIAMVDVC